MRCTARIMFCRIHAFVLCAAIALSLAAPVRADERPFSNGSRTRGLTGGGHSWRQLFGKTRSQITFVAFAPRMGWFVTDRLELYGEGTLFLGLSGFPNAILGPFGVFRG